MKYSHNVRTTLTLLPFSLLILTACGEESTSVPDTSPTQVTTAPAQEHDEQENIAEKPAPSGEVPTAVPPMESSFDADGDGFMTRDELRTALNARLPEFDWPNGYTLSLETVFSLHTSEVPADAVFENNAEYSMIGIPHMCAWGKTWLDANQSGDALTQETAMNQLTTVTLTLPPLRFVVDYYSDIFDNAQLGDVAPLQNLLNTRCNWDLFDSTPAANMQPIRSARESA